MMAAFAVAGAGAAVPPAVPPAGAAGGGGGGGGGGSFPPGSPGDGPWCQYGYCKMCAANIDDKHLSGKRHQRALAQDPLSWQNEWHPTPAQNIQAYNGTPGAGAGPGLAPNVVPTMPLAQAQAQHNTASLMLALQTTLADQIDAVATRVSHIENSPMAPFPTAVAAAAGIAKAAGPPPAPLRLLDRRCVEAAADPARTPPRSHPALPQRPHHRIAVDRRA